MDANSGRMDVAELVPRFRQMAKEVGREPDQLQLLPLVYSQKKIRSKTVDAGIDRIIFALPPELPVVIPILDDLANIATKYRIKGYHDDFFTIGYRFSKLEFKNLSMK